MNINNLLPSAFPTTLNNILPTSLPTTISNLMPTALPATININNVFQNSLPPIPTNIKSNLNNMFLTPLPAPRGPFQVGYLDLMTPGLPHTSSYLRLHYPVPAGIPSTEAPPRWADMECQVGLVKFMQTMVWNWPSWVNNAEFTLLPLFNKTFTPEGFNTFFNLGWSLIGQNLTIPIIRAAPIALSKSGWPVVVFSPGMGCNRFTMSQLAYQLASMGVVVVVIEHRDGSSFKSSYKIAKNMEVEVPHVEVAIDDNEYEVRNSQINHRSAEIIRALDLVYAMNNGGTIENVSDDASNSDLGLFKSSMDLNNLYLMGHSFGGSSAILASSDNRVKSVFVLDPWMFPLAKQKFEIDKPLTVMNTANFVNEKNLKVIKEAANNNDYVNFDVIKGGVHLSSTDIPSVFIVTWVREALGFRDKREPEDVMIETNQVVWDWLQQQTNEV